MSRPSDGNMRALTFKQLVCVASSCKLWPWSIHNWGLNVVEINFNLWIWCDLLHSNLFKHHEYFLWTSVRAVCVTAKVRQTIRSLVSNNSIESACALEKVQTIYWKLSSQPVGGTKHFRVASMILLSPHCFILVTIILFHRNNYMHTFLMVPCIVWNHWLVSISVEKHLFIRAKVMLGWNYCSHDS